MREIVKKCSNSSVSIDGEVVSKIKLGLNVLVGFTQTDTEEDLKYMVRKIVNLRIFEDEQGKTNLSLADVDGGLLLVSQFTLYANCKRGNRPSFIEAGKPDMANELYEYICEECKKSVPVVEKGVFGAHMHVSLLNDGPFTIILDSRDL